MAGCTIWLIAYYIQKMWLRKLSKRFPFDLIEKIIRHDYFLNKGLVCETQTRLLLFLDFPPMHKTFNPESGQIERIDTASVIIIIFLFLFNLLSISTVIFVQKVDLFDRFHCK